MFVTPDNTGMSAPYHATKVSTPDGLVIPYTLFVIELKSRRVHIAGITTKPDAAFVEQVAHRETPLPSSAMLHARFCAKP